MRGGGGGGGGGSGGSIEPPILKQLTSKTCKYLKETQSFLKFLKVHIRVTTIFNNDILKHADFASEWRKSRFRGLEIRDFKIFRGDAIETPLLKTWIRASLARLCSLNTSELRQRRRRPRGKRLVKNEFIFFLRISQLSTSVQCAYWPQNLLK